MQGVDMFCERCGSRQPAPAPEQNTPGVIARRLLNAAGLTDGAPAPTELFLRLCLNCREYSCPTCWNEDMGVCQTCAPVPEPVVIQLPEPVYVELPEPVVIEVAPILVAEAEVEPEPILVAEAEVEPEPILVAEAEVEPEPILVAEAEVEPEPILVAEAEVEPEPILVAEAEVEPEPVSPRMPVLPLPRPRPHVLPDLPLPTLVEYPVQPHMHFQASTQTTAHALPEYPAYAHLPAPTRIATSTTSVRPCQNCSLSLSARARFCRRCGSAQAAA